MDLRWVFFVCEAHKKHPTPLMYFRRGTGYCHAEIFSLTVIFTLLRSPTASNAWSIVIVLDESAGSSYSQYQH